MPPVISITLESKMLDLMNFDLSLLTSELMIYFKIS
jgi:hypothetical protein